MNNRPMPTPEQARAELDRRQAARAELQKRQFDSSLAGSLSKIPGLAAGAAIALPGQIADLATQVPGAVKKIATHPVNALQDVLGGGARGLQNLAATMGEAGQWIGDTSVKKLYKDFTGKNLNIPKVDIREEMGLGKNNPVDLGALIQNHLGNQPNQLLSGIGQYAPGAAAGGARAIPLIASNALNAAAQAPPGQRLQAGVQGAVDVGLPIGVGRAANAMRPSKLLAGNLTPEQLQANLEAAKGTTTGLGDVVGSPFLKRTYENVLPRVPFSGATQKMQQTATQLTQKGQEHLAKLGEGLPEGDMGSYLQDALKKASKEAVNEKNANFKKANDIADQEGLVVPRQKFQAKAQSILNDIDESPELKRKLSPEIMADLQSYARGEKGNTLRLSNIFKGKIGAEANEHYIAGRSYEYGVLKDLKNALGEDIEDTISSSKNPELKEAFDKSMKDYATKFAPFEDPDITKFTREGGDPDMMLSHFLRTGANDRSTLLSKVQSKLPPKMQNLLPSMYLSKAIDENGQLNPLKMRTLYSKLGENQKKTLIQDTEMRKSLDKYTKSVGMNTEAFQTMLNPHTGQRVSDMIPMAGAIAGHSLMGGGIPGLVGAAAGAVVPGLLGKMATRYITNPTTREALVKAILKSKGGLEEVKKKVNKPDIPVSYFDNGNMFSVHHKDDALSMENRGNGSARVLYSKVEIPGKGTGKALYKAAIEAALKRGLNFESHSVVSDSAMNVYKSLEKEGYKFEYNPNVRREKVGYGPGAKEISTVSINDDDPVVRLISTPSKNN